MLKKLYLSVASGIRNVALKYKPRLHRDMYVN